MERKAVNSSGRIGCLYDARGDRIFDISQTNHAEKHFQTFEIGQCKLINGNTEESNNLLQWMDVETELRLSLLLKLTKRDGIGAILDYSKRIDEYTRLLHYSWIARRQRLQDLPKVTSRDPILYSYIRRTHIITSVDMGIDAIIVLQLPSNGEIVQRIDRILDKICDSLRKNSNHSSSLSTDEYEVLARILNTTIYSNILGLTSLSSISQVLRCIDRIKQHPNRWRPVSYTLQPTTSLYYLSSHNTVRYKPVPSELANDIEQTMIQFRSKLKYLEALLHENDSKISKTNPIRLSFFEMKDKYIKEIQRFANVIVKARKNELDIFELYRALDENEQIISVESIKQLIQQLEEYQTKRPSTASIIQQGISYSDPAIRALDRNTDERTMGRRTASANPQNRAVAPSDIFRVNNQRHRSVEKHPHTCVARPASADFSSAFSRLQHIKISPLRGLDRDRSNSEPKESSAFHASRIFSESRSTTNEMINILLLGETGVGKSTFINALVNYLKFSSLEQVEFDEPNIIIPSAFTMTIGDHFEECTIQFGEFDRSDNEHFNRVGQSITQHCKSYVFGRKENEKKLRVIDTPGFGDIRGIEHDNQTMEHILQYINDLTHLNAICFLLRANSTKLNLFFQTCLTQLFSFLAPAARQNVIFCFINARSTFNVPGHTGSLLKTMLNSLSISNISFGRENTFCFDIQWFRYLFFLSNEVRSNPEMKDKCEQRWLKAVKESIRFVDYIDKNLSIYHMNNGCQSMKQAQFQISRLIRPILEAMRHILRNIILSKENFSNQFIELHAEALDRAATRCLSCKSDPNQVGNFWILSQFPHEIHTECFICSCHLDQHISIDYLLKYQCSSKASSHHQNQANDALDRLCNASVEFAHFLMHVVRSSKDDPFFIGLVEMIVEEAYIVEIRTPALFNKQLIEELRKLENQYEQRINQMKPNQEYAGLSAIYELITTVSEYPLVREQLVAGKKTQQMMMEHREEGGQRICYTSRL